MFFGHTYELLIVLVIALVFFGPKRLPELGSSLGTGLREFRKATKDLKGSIDTDAPAALPAAHEAPAAPAAAEYVTVPAHEAELTHK